MNLDPHAFEIIDWEALPAETIRGEKGHASSRTARLGGLRVRKIAYSPGYLADHWCTKGHVVLVLEGELTSELQDGRVQTLRAGMGYHAGDPSTGHRSSTERGAVLFIVD